MVPALRSEFKKMFSIRSTYGWVLLALIIVGIYGFYGEGFNDVKNLLKAGAPDAGAKLFVAATINQMVNFISVFGSIIALLLITHEYRYNTITYTLTAANSRTKVLLSKILAVIGFVLVYSVLLTLFGLGMIFLGLAFSHSSLPHQDISYLTYIGKSLFVCEAYSLVALLFGVLIRHQAGAFVALFIVPNTVEGLLSLLLKSKTVYLPFGSLQEVIQTPVIPGSHPAHVNPNGVLTPAKGALVFLVYLLVGWAITWYLFLKRDAN
jgi:ABC-2 type transport system permease protein